MITGRYAVIPTHDRLQHVWACADLISDQVDEVIIIDNASDPPVPEHPEWNIYCDSEQPPNLSRLWNMGLKEAANLAESDGLETWYVAILNDDALPPPGWMDAVVAAMEETGAVAGCSHPNLYGERTFLGPEAHPGIWTRLTGWAFVLKQPMFLADEQFRWWCGDDDLSMRARAGGGLVYAEGFSVPNTLANTSTNGVLAEQANQDVEAFINKWGMHPFL
jgi:hypothetical protein